jgi:hypothetical protein
MSFSALKLQSLRCHSATAWSVFEMWIAMNSVKQVPLTERFCSLLIEADNLRLVPELHHQKVKTFHVGPKKIERLLSALCFNLYMYLYRSFPSITYS